MQFVQSRNKPKLGAAQKFVLDNILLHGEAATRSLLYAEAKKNNRTVETVRAAIDSLIAGGIIKPVVGGGYELISLVEGSSPAKE
jgi:hypothetical protein